MTNVLNNLEWHNRTAYGPRGTFYELVPVEGQFYVMANSAKIGQAVTEEGAMGIALNHAGSVIDQAEIETAAINGASDRARVTFTG